MRNPELTRETLTAPVLDALAQLATEYATRADRRPAHSGSREVDLTQAWQRLVTPATVLALCDLARQGLEAADLCARLKMEAQVHAQEARTQAATVAECYQVATCATGEPGNWHGAEPIRALKTRAEQAEARVQQLDAAAFTQLKKAREEIASMPTREEWLGGQRTKYVQVDEVLAYIDAALRGAS